MHSPLEPFRGGPQDRDAALAFLFGRIDYERSAEVPPQSRGLKLERMRELLAELGDPQDQLRVVHVAGTKGKGSTSALIASALTHCGLRTGLYTSPHLERLEERMRIDGRTATADELVALVQQVHDVVQRMDRRAAASGYGNGPTYFEITTAMAMLHFAQAGVDAAVLEVGLGGRLDSTNVCRPLVSVITSISYDHMKQLGNTLAEIAGEKAGIIKPHVPVVTGVTAAEPLQVIERRAAELDCRLLRLGHEFHATYEPAGTPDHRAQVSYSEQGELPWELQQVTIGLLGRHQAANAAVALASLNRLRSVGWQLPEAGVRAGLAAASCPARVELVCPHPAIIVDAAHNVASVEALVQTLVEQFSTANPRLLIFATSRDKDCRGMLRSLLPHFQHVIFTRYQKNPRGVDPIELAQLADQLEREGATPPGGQVRHAVATPDDAWEQVLSALPAHPLICITGSFFIAAELRDRARAANHAGNTTRLEHV